MRRTPTKQRRFSLYRKFARLLVFSPSESSLKRLFCSCSGFPGSFRRSSSPGQRHVCLYHVLSFRSDLSSVVSVRCPAGQQVGEHPFGTAQQKKLVICEGGKT